MIKMRRKDNYKFDLRALLSTSFAFLFIALFQFSFPAFAQCGISQITDSPGDNQVSSAFGDKIIYKSNREGDWDIYLYDTSTEKEVPICINPSEQRNAKIYENKIVWEDNRNGNWDIYMCEYNPDASGQSDIQITNDRGNDTSPAIHGENIVYISDRNGNKDIYRYNLTLAANSRPAEFQVTNDVSDEDQVAIYGDNIVYKSYRVDTHKLYINNIAEGTHREISAGPGNKYFPDIDKNIVVWQDYRGMDGATATIYMYEIDTGIATRITGFYSNHWYPKVSGDKIIWGDDRSHPYEGPGIYMYDLTSRTESVITNNNASRPFFLIHEDKIFWSDNRTGSYEVYMARLPMVQQVEQKITSLTPSRNFVGQDAFSLTVYGAGFNLESKVLWNGSERPTTYISSSELKAEISAADLVSAGEVNIEVYNPSTQEATSSNTKIFKILDLSSPADPLEPDLSVNKLLLSFQDGLIDSSDNPKEIQAHGEASVNSIQRTGVIDNKAVLLDGDGDYLTIADSDDWSFSNNNFSIDFWVRFNSLPENGELQFLYDQRGDHYTYQFLGILNQGGAGAYYFYGNAYENGTGVYNAEAPVTLNIDTWYHMVFLRDSNTFEAYLDGNLIISVVRTQGMPDVAAPFAIGASAFQGIGHINAWIDDFKISKGIEGGSSDQQQPLSSMTVSSVYVDDNYSEGNCGNHIWRYNAFNDLKEAVDNTAVGGTVYVAAGSYNLDSPISLDKPITLIGEETYPENVIINAPAGLEQYNDCFQVRSSNVTISGFKIQGALDRKEQADGSAGIDIGGLRTTIPIPGLENINITNNIIYNNAYGIYLYAAKHVTISQNDISSSHTANINGHWTGKGIVLLGTGIAFESVNDIKILNNEIHENMHKGIELDNNILDRNLWYTTAVVIDGNKIFDNGSVIKHDTVYHHDGQGIFLNDYTDGVTIANNEIYEHLARTDKLFYGDTSGIRAVDSRNLVIEKNNIRSNTRGVNISGSSSRNVTFENNIVTQNAQGVVFEGGQTGSISGNSIYGNDNINYVALGLEPYGVLNTGEGQINAVNNWWGAANGPTKAGTGSGDNVSENVVFGPWYTDDQQDSTSEDATAPVLNSIDITDAKLYEGVLYSKNRVIKISINASETTFGFPPVEVLLSEHPDFNSAQWAALASSNTFELSEIDGLKTIYAKVKDRRGVESGVKSAVVILDQQAPIVQFRGLPGKLTRTPSINITVTGEGVVSYRSKLDGETIYSVERSRNEPIARDNLADGIHDLWVIASDAAGNPQEVYHYSWVVDTIAPQAVEITGTPDPTTEESSITVYVGGKDVAAYKYTFDGAAFQEKSKEIPISKINLADGDHRLEIFARDTAGNWIEEPRVIEWIVVSVNEKPVIDDFSPSDEVFNKKEGEVITFAVDAHDPEGKSPTYSWYVDGKVFIEQGSSPGFTYLFDYDTSTSDNNTRHKVGVIVSDGAYHEVDASRGWTVIVEDVDIHPQIKSVSPVNNKISIEEGNSYTFFVDASDPRQRTLEYDWYIDGVLKQGPELDENSKRFIFTPGYQDSTSETGKVYIVKVVVSNKEKKLDVSREWSVTVNDVNSRPAIVSSLPAVGSEQKLRQGSSLTFSVVAQDNEDRALNFEWKLDGEVEFSKAVTNPAAGVKTLSSYTYSPEFTPALLGRHELELEVSDGKSTIPARSKWDILVIEAEDKPVLSWEFNSGSDEGWKNEGSLRAPVISSGVYRAEFKAVNPKMNGPEGINIDAAKYQTLRLRYKISSGMTAQLSWKTFPELEQPQQVQAFSVLGDGRFHVVDVDLSSNSYWKGTITNIGLIPVSGVNNGAIEVDYIRILEGAPVAPAQWEFNIDNDSQGWMPRKDLTPFEVTGGLLKTSVTGRDSIMDIGGIRIDADAYKGIEIACRLDRNVDASGNPVKEIGELRWLTQDGIWSRARIDVVPDGEFHVYSIDFSGIPEWRGKVNYLRLDPTVVIHSTNLEIDYIKVVTQAFAEPRWEFNEDYNAQGWNVIRESLTGLEVRNGLLYTSVAKDDPKMEIGNIDTVNPFVSINANNYKAMSIRMKAEGGKRAKLFWKNSQGLYAYFFDIVPGTEAYTYNIDLSKNPDWKGNIFYLRFDPIDSGWAIGNQIEIDFIRILDTLPGLSWNFSKDNDSLGWVPAKNNNLSDLAVSSGTMKAGISGSDPYMFNKTINFSAEDYPYLQIRYSITNKNSAGIDTGKFFWAIRDERGRLTSKAASFDINADGIPHTYVIDLGSNPDWRGQIAMLRLDPIDSIREFIVQENFEIDYIRFSKVAPKPEAQEWFFDYHSNIQGWSIKGGESTLKTENGSLVALLSKAVNPYLKGPLGQPIDADAYKKIEIRMKVNGDHLSEFPSLLNAQLKLYWLKKGDKAISEEMVKVIPIKVDSNPYTYELDMSSEQGWSGEIRQLVIYPVSAIPEFAETSFPDVSNYKIEVYVDHIRVKE